MTIKAKQLFYRWMYYIKKNEHKEKETAGHEMQEKSENF